MKSKRFFIFILSLALLSFCFFACAKTDPLRTEETPTPESARETDTAETSETESERNEPETGITETDNQEEEKMIYAKVNGNVLTIKPENNSSADAFIKMLEGGDVTVKMHDYGGFEKVGPLGNTLPTNDATITTSPGDVILYQGDQITVYYGVNTWSFTLLGKVQGMSRDELKSALGLNDTEITFSIKKSAGTE